MNPQVKEKTITKELFQCISIRISILFLAVTIVWRAECFMKNVSVPDAQKYTEKSPRYT